MQRRIRTVARKTSATAETTATTLSSDAIDVGDGRTLPRHRGIAGVAEADWPGREPGLVVATRLVARHLAVEEVDLWPVDLSGNVATFVADIDADTQHERDLDAGWFRALDSSDPLFATVARIPAAPVAFEPMTARDLGSVVEWQQAPQSREWFLPGPADLIAAKARYGSRLRGESSIRMWVVVVAGIRCGYIQDYRVDHDEHYGAETGQPDAVGIDFVIGDSHLVGLGLGPRVVWAYLRDVLCRDHPTVPTFLASPDERNTRSLRALEKCGFVRRKVINLPAEPGEVLGREVVCTLDRSTWFGAATA